MPQVMAMKPNCAFDAEDFAHPDGTERARPRHADALHREHRRDHREDSRVRFRVGQARADVAEHAFATVSGADASIPKRRNQRQDDQPGEQRQRVDVAALQVAVQEAHERQGQREGELLGHHLQSDRARQLFPCRPPRAYSLSGVGISIAMLPEAANVSTSSSTIVALPSGSVIISRAMRALMQSAAHSQASGALCAARTVGEGAADQAEEEHGAAPARSQQTDEQHFVVRVGVLAPNAWVMNCMRMTKLTTPEPMSRSRKSR